jgi:hypothetical protein
MCLIFRVEETVVLQAMTCFLLDNEYAVLNISRRAGFTDLWTPTTNFGYEHFLFITVTTNTNF